MLFVLYLIPCHAMMFVKNNHGTLWQEFKQNYISDDGRVIDFTTKDKITTSEGQSYALFFALVANDREFFDKILQWTEDNLAQGDLSHYLPAWVWGQNNEQEWGIKDKNSASDADLWIAYDLLEAGRLWNNSKYKRLGKRLLQQIKKKEVINIPGLGLMLMPGSTGFSHPPHWTLNPSYLPLQLLTRFSQIDSDWIQIKTNSIKLLVETSPLGYSPDWINWEKNKGWQPDSETPNIGSYNAIRVYLWLGLLADDAKEKTRLTTHFQPIINATQQRGVPPEQINVLKGTFEGNGPVGFSAALLPLMNHSPSQAAQTKRVENFSLSSHEYYNAVLTLFGLGWLQNHYRFNNQGELIPDWSITSGHIIIHKP